MSVSPRSPRILLVGTSDVGGGAELSAWNLFTAYRNHGYAVQVAVGRKHADCYLGWYESVIAGRQPVASTVPTEPGPNVVPSAIGLNR
jgi:hypothetical protein